MSVVENSGPHDLLPVPLWNNLTITVLPSGGRIVRKEEGQC
jgi:hypothetical protein